MSDERRSGRPDQRSESAETLPRHIAFIMDGNGRWAKRRGFLRLRGHEEGASSLRRITRHCRSLGVKEVTFYALSTENFSRRPKREVDFLLSLLKSFMVDERPELLENDIRLHALGETSRFPDDVIDVIAETERLTAHCQSMVLRLALNYGSRQEIVAAVQKIVEAVACGALSPEDVAAMTPREFGAFLLDPTMSDPDLLIRTAGECRLSNFLLWQCSYTEIWVTPQLWPDFDVPGLNEALRAYARRIRKYGALAPDDSGASSREDAVEAGHPPARSE